MDFCSHLQKSKSPINVLQSADQVFQNAMKDPLNLASVVYIDSLINSIDSDGHCHEIKEYLDHALYFVFKDPFSEASEMVIKLWLAFNDKIGINCHERLKITRKYEESKILALKNHLDPKSLFPLQFSIDDDTYVMMNQVEEDPKCLKFHGCANNNAQEILEFRLYSDHDDYYRDFDGFRTTMQLLDYNERIGLIIIKSSDIDSVHDCKSGLPNDFLSDNSDDILKARLKPLEMQSQIVMGNYISLAEKLNYSKYQCRIIVQAFLDDLIHSASENPLILINERCIRKWLINYRQYFSDSEIKCILDDFSSKKLDYLVYNPRISSFADFPVEIVIANRTFNLTGELGRGRYGVTFNGYAKGEQDDYLVIKVLFRKGYARYSFMNEISALNRIERLVLYDVSKMVICQRKVIGVPLNLILSSCKLGSNLEKKLFKKYMNLGNKFYEQYRLIHGDIRPENVIVDQNQNMELIDFGMTKYAANLTPNVQSCLDRDYAKALDEYKYFFARIEAYRASENPYEETSREKILEYIDCLQKTKRFHDLHFWRNFYKQKYCSFN